MWRWRLALVGIVALAASTAPRQDGARADLDAKLAVIERRGEQVEDLTASFEQHKHTALLREPMVSSGTVRVRAGRVLWETKEPRPSMMGIEEKRAIVFFPRQKTAEIYPLRGEVQLLGASPLPRIAKLREAFEIREADATDLVERAPAGAIGLALSPRPGPMRDHIERVRALVDMAVPALVALEIVDVDGDRTLIRFSDIRTNQGLAERDVTLRLADDIEVSHPAGRPEEGPDEGAGEKPGEISGDREPLP
jgi:hypothetical protein